MDGSSTSDDGGVILDSFGQQILPIYTQICLCFPIDEPQAYPRVVETLETALEKLHVQFPWLAGRVVNEGATASSTGVFKIKTVGEAPRLVVKDLREDSSFPSMDALRLARFPINALDESIVAPRKTRINADYSAAPEVLLVQANLIKGGLILTFLGQHQAMDGIGQDQIIRLFSKACRTEAFTDKELLICNLTTASDTIPLLEASNELPPNSLHPPTHHPPILLRPQPPTLLLGLLLLQQILPRNPKVDRSPNLSSWRIQLHIHRRRSQRLHLEIHNVRSSRASEGYHTFNLRASSGRQTDAGNLGHAPGLRAEHDVQYPHLQRTALHAARRPRFPPAL